MAATPLTQELLEQIGRAIRSLRYGTVHIIVHNEQVVQIEKVERIRFAGSPDLTSERGAQQSPPTVRTSGEKRMQDGGT